MFSLRRRRSDREGEHGFVDVVVAGGDGQLRNLVGFIGKKLEYEGAEQRIEIHDKRNWRTERVWPE